MGQVSERGLALIRRFEGFSPRAYVCPAGKRTIGYGHVVQTWEHFPAGGITLGQAEELLWKDATIVAKSVNRLTQERASQGQFDAMVSFVYNTGIKAFEKSTLLRLFLSGDEEGAARQFDRWIYGGGKVLDGLRHRRLAERAVFEEKGEIS